MNFSKTFYSHIYSSKLSVCQAFESAKNHVKKLNGALESDKFKLFLGGKHSKDPCVGNKIRRRMVPGVMEFKGSVPKILRLPRKVTPFISRNVDMFDVLRLLQEENVV